MELDTKSISILNKPRKTVTSPRLLTINHERQKPLFCPKTLARQALEPQVFRPESLQQNYLCKNCRRQFIDSYSPLGYPDSVKKYCLHLYLEGNG